MPKKDKIPQGDVTPMVETKNRYIAPEPPKKKGKISLIIVIGGLVALATVVVAGLMVKEMNRPGEAESSTAVETERMCEETMADETDEVTTAKVVPEEVTTVEGEETTAEVPTEEMTTAHVHIETVMAGVAPTCTETGLTGRVQCEDCGEILAEQEVIEATGHTEKIIPATPATCTVAGKTQGMHCLYCSAIFVAQSIIPAKGHTNGEWIVDKEPEEGVEGSKYTTCSTCGEKLVETIRCSQGLEYISNGIDTYAIRGVGTCTDTDVYIPSAYNGMRVTGISAGAFRDCAGLTSINIPDSVTSIGEYAFDGCSGLTSIYIPASVTSVGCTTFNRCAGLIEIHVAERNSIFHSDGNCLIQTESKTLILGCTSSIIPTDGSVTSIGSYAFSGYADLIFIDIPDSVTNIGDYAFSDCSGLTSIVIPDSVTRIGSSAFSDCSGLTSIVIPDSVTRIGSSAFSDCSGLTSITIPFVGSTKDGDWNMQFFDIFGKNYKDVPVSLKSVVITGGSSISNDAFNGCSGLTSIVIPDSVTSIGDSAFGGCSNLTSIVIPDGVTCINPGLFVNCINLLSVDIPDSVISIGSSAFASCHHLTSISIPDGVTSIGAHAFDNCMSLVSVDIPQGLVSIGSYAFSCCSGLVSMSIPDGVTSIGVSAFSYCHNLTEIKVEEGNPVYHSEGNCLIETASGLLIAGCTNSIIPDDGTVITIGESAFSGRAGLTVVSIPDSVISIGDDAFRECDLVSIVVPYGVTSIGDYSFYNCFYLTTIVISDSVISIGKNAFDLCTRLTDIYYTGTEDEWKEITGGFDMSDFTHSTIHYNYTS